MKLKQKKNRLHLKILSKLKNYKMIVAIMQD